jgi:radical SAM protein
MQHGKGRHPGGADSRMGFSVDFQQAPLLVIWEVTRACELACQHCRADAINQRDPRELSTDEGKHLLERIRDMGTPIVVFTGGDPIQRDDLEELIRHGKSLGLRLGTIPAGTPRLTRERLASLRDAGIDQLAFSIDAPEAGLHDGFRKVEGSFALTMQGARWTTELGVPLQINTVFSAFNVDRFDELAALVTSLEVVFWEVFFLVPTGRGTVLESCTAAQYEMLFEKLYRLSQDAAFTVKVTEGQHYRRYVMQQQGQGPVAAHGPAVEVKPASHGHAIGMSSKVVNAGHGFCFVDHVGDMYPSGFLPIVTGNVRERDIAVTYREHPLFNTLRDFSQLKGKCGRCEFRDACAGSRSRAYAVHGDYLAEEPFCILER